jgi:hypothetical protein
VALTLIDFSSHNLSGWASIAQIVVTVVAVLALIGATVQTLLTRSANRHTLTDNYTARWSDPTRNHLMVKTIETLTVKKGETPDQRWDQFHASSLQDQFDAMVIPNLVEEIAGMYNRGLLDKTAAKEYFGYPAHALWKRAEWFVYRARKDDSDYFIQWEAMLRKMKLLS